MEKSINSIKGVGRCGREREREREIERERDRERERKRGEINDYNQLKNEERGGK